VASDLLCAFEDFPLIFLESNRRAFWYNQMEDFIQCCIKHRMFHTPPYCNWIEIICNLLLTWILFPTSHLFSHPLSLSLCFLFFFNYCAPQTRLPCVPQTTLPLKELLLTPTYM
jgi:hypothetical protein